MTKVISQKHYAPGFTLKLVFVSGIEKGIIALRELPTQPRPGCNGASDGGVPSALLG